MKINKIAGSKVSKTSAAKKQARGVETPLAKGKSKFDPSNPYAVVSDIYCPPTEPGKEIPMANVCPRDRATGEPLKDKRYLSLSRGKLAILFSHPSILEDLQAWYNKQAAK